MATDTQIAIVGGGAAGLAAAISAVQRGCDVTVIEQADRLGKRILATGNGRCNLSNAALDTEKSVFAYNNPKFVQGIIASLGFEDIREFFADLGLMVHVDAEGRVYPRSNSANSVLDVLLNAISSLRVRERCNFAVKSIDVGLEDGFPAFRLSTLEGESLTADAVILATGPDVMPLIDAELARVWREPVLGPLHTQTAPLKGLNGVRVRCAASLRLEDEVFASEYGELLFRDYGLSGIVVFELSRYLQPEQEISLDYFPEYSDNELRELLDHRLQKLNGYSINRFFDGMLHRRVAQAILRNLSYSSYAPAQSMQLERLAHILKDHRFKVTGGPTQAQAQVMRGGLATTGFSPQTLESIRLPKFFAVGEALDIDGRTGGYNLHWAWASGIVAGRAACEAIAQQDSR